MSEETLPTKSAKYEPTKSEEKSIERYLKTYQERRPFPDLTVKPGEGVTNIGSVHDDEPMAVCMQMDALGLGSHHELASILLGVVGFTSVNGEARANKMTEAMSLMVGLEPRNTTEALLATQMAAIHLATMEAARRLHRTAVTPEAIGLNTKALNNLARTFAAQVEAMKKLKGGGEQKVNVEHRHYHLAPGAVAPGSQAVIGDLNQGRGTNKKEHQPHVRSIPEREAVHGDFETERPAVPRSGGRGLASVPVPWSSRGRTERAA